MLVGYLCTMFILAAILVTTTYRDSKKVCRVISWEEYYDIQRKEHR